MKFIHRLGYYMGGFSIGLILLAFFLSGKKTSCDYGPDARVLKNIRTKTLVFNEQSEVIKTNNAMDSTLIAFILKRGDVNFSESNTDLISCKIYVVEKEIEDINYKLTIENCEKTATVQEIKVE
ncbi:MAG: hypothetical protein KC469_03480 [Flavobacteriaceae bacterium]|nr:hypothetical protein [Flavobacteriaceae bacterium]